MKKTMQIILIALSAFIVHSSYASTAIQALFKCETKSGTYFQPLVNGTVNIATNGEFLPTDANGYFYLDDSYQGKEVQIYLAQGTTILVDCRSRLTPLNLGEAVLGELGSSCPCGQS